MHADHASEYEYVVVGSGAGGGPVAANLAEAGHTVLVLEAGGVPPAPDYEYGVPAFHTLASEDPSMSWKFFVRHYGDRTQQQRDTKYCPTRDGVFYPRAGTLGGCTAHNAMILIRPSDRDWDYIATLTGDDSWQASRMGTYFERLEKCQYRPLWRFVKRAFRWNPGRHGFDGWLETAEADPTLAIHDRALLKIVKRAAVRSLVGLGNPIARLKLLLKTWFDPNDFRGASLGLEGIRLTPLSTCGGRRTGPRDLLLRTQKAHPDLLTIKTNALATRVLFGDDNRAVGVEFLEGTQLYGVDPKDRRETNGQLQQVRATREVILAGGAFNTPQLLQLSGIGPAEVLKAHGIDVRVNLPGVGANLQDRYEVGVVTRMKKPFRMLEGATMTPPQSGEAPDTYLQQWIDSGRSIYTSNGVAVAILKKSSPELPEPDLIIFGLVTNFRGYYPGYSKDVTQSHQYFTWAILKGYTHNNAGVVTIRSRDPRDMPEVNFHYFHEGTDREGTDLKAVTDAVEFVRSVTRHYQHLIDVEEVPGDQVRTRKDLETFVTNEAWGHHASCTCAIGPDGDPMAVLDSNFRVRGTSNLRVVDASVFPRIPALFIVSAIYMAAEKASDVILSDAKGVSRGEHR